MISVLFVNMKSENVLRKILIATVAANILMFFGLVGLIIYNQRHQNSETQNKAGLVSQSFRLPENAGVCSACDYLGPNIKSNDTLFSSIHSVGGKKVCCMDKPEFLPKLMRMIIMTEEERKSDSMSLQDIYRDLNWWRSRPNSVHANLDLEKIKENKFVWRTDNDPLGVAFSNGIEINKESNSIVVPGPQRKRYFVYVAITYDFGDIDTVPVFYHNVTKSHPLLPKTIETLLMSKYGGSSESDRKYTSFLCGNFEIQGDFNIKTEVSNYDFVSLSKYSSYFGMFQL